MMKRTAVLFTVLLVFLSAQAAGALELGSTGQVSIHGFITQGYILSSDNNFFGPTSGDGSFEFNERGINFSSEVSDRLRLGLQVFSRDFGTLGNNEVTIDWAYADYAFTEWANFKAGKVKLVHGLYNTSRDVDMLRTSVFLPQSVYNEGWRDSINAMNGFEFYGYAPAGRAGSFEYHLQGGVMDLKDDGAEVRLLEDQIPAWMNMNVTSTEINHTVATGFLWETPLDGLRVGASGWQLDFDAPFTMDLTEFGIAVGKTELGIEESLMEVTQTGWTTSLEYAIGDFVFATEYNRINYELFGKSPYPGLRGDVDKDFDSEGYYGMVTYRFCDWFELGTYYSEYYANRNDKDGKSAAQTWTNGKFGPGTEGGYPPGQEHRAYLKDIALSLRFDITENWIFKVEGHKMRGGAIMLNSDDNTAEYPSTLMPLDGPSYVKNWELYTAKVSYNF